MTKIAFSKLSRGDIILHKVSGEQYLVDANYDGRVVAVNTIETTDSEMWDVVLKAEYKTPVIDE